MSENKTTYDKTKHCNACWRKYKKITPAVERIDRGTSIGIMCPDCHDALIESCRKRSW